MSRTIIIIFTLILCLGSKDAYSYAFTPDFNNGFYWKSFPVQITVEESDPSERDRLISYLNHSIKVWEDEVGYDIWEFQNSGTTANVVRWSDNFAADTGFDPTTTLGVTIRYNLGTYYQRVEIILNRGAKHLVANDSNLLYQTILHEIGHTVGLGHHSEDHGIMIPFIGSVNEISFDDVEGMRAVIDETLWRQDTGYISDMATTTTRTAGCAANGISPGQTGTSNGLSFAVSLLIGLAATFAVRKLFPLMR